MDDGRSVLICYHPNLQWSGCCGWSDEHGGRRVVGLERSPMMLKCVQHVLVRDTVLACARLDVHGFTVPADTAIVNTS